MKCTGVIRCLSSGLVKNDKIIFMFFPISEAFLGHFQSFTFYKIGGQAKESNMIIYVSCSKIQQLRSRERIEVRPTENDSTRLYKNGDISVVITCSQLKFGR